MNYLSNAAKISEKANLNKSDEVKEIMRKDKQRVKDLEIEKKALKEGDFVPDFKLMNALGEWKSMYKILEEGPAIISFYRGGWCPYCNLELAGYQELLPQIKDLGANLIAISPEIPDESMNLVERHSLEYEVLSDMSNKVAKQFGLVFTISEEIKELYKLSGLDINKAQANEDNELPVPATYVVASDGKILLSHVDSDYTNRLEPEDAIELLRTLTF